ILSIARKKTSSAVTCPENLSSAATLLLLLLPVVIVQVQNEPGLDHALKERDDPHLGQFVVEPDVEGDPLQDPDGVFELARHRLEPGADLIAQVVGDEVGGEVVDHKEGL